MSMLLSAILLFAALVVVGGLLHGYRKLRRDRGARIPDGEQVVLEVDRVSVRLYVNRSIPGGPSAPGGRDRARLVLTQERLLLCTGHGRVVEINSEQGGSVRSTGPGRLVIEGMHPSGRADVRAELTVQNAEQWQACAAHLSTQTPRRVV
jgi:hypothetical protein